MKKFFKIFFEVLLYAFAAIGLFFTAVFVGMHFGLFNVRGSIASRNSFFSTTPAPAAATTPACTDGQPTCAWDATPEWATISGGLQKDAPVIDQVSTQTGVSARMIAAVVMPEQTRFFTANREIFKSYFEPLKTLGVSGIKQTTADDIEKYALDPTSPFYPGQGMSDLFAYAPGTNHDTELYNRLTDTKNHYYQYLYTALFIKEIDAQWAGQGFDISRNPEAVVTLFNLGFQASHPNASPQVAGSAITTGGQTYAYGQLGSDFYASQDLSDVFPQ